MTSIIPQEVPAELARDIARLQEVDGKYVVNVIVEGQRIYLLFPEFDMGPEYTPRRTTLMIFTTTQYPLAGFDMFWALPHVRLAKNGGVPQAGEAVEAYMSQQWQRFSWHLNRPWAPPRDNLLSWMATVEERILKGV